MKKKTALLIFILLTSLTAIAYVQAKKPGPTTNKEAYSDYLTLTYDTSSQSSTYTPPGPETVTVWIFPDSDIDDGETFQVSIKYNNLWTYQSFPANDIQIYNRYPLLAVDHVDIAYPMEIVIYRNGNVGDDSETFEIQWIIEH